MDDKDLALAVAKLAQDKKADDVAVLDIRKASAFCDYFVIASAESVKKTAAIADHIEESLHNLGIRPHHVEGRSDSRWILLDYSGVICHIFYEETRRFYELEKLWGDAKRISIEA